jgi:ABC-2 type transport system ATP-binding protein
MVTDDGTSLTIVTREPAIILAALADRRALASLRAQGGSLEDVFLDLTGREYRA